MCPRLRFWDNAVLGHRFYLEVEDRQAWVSRPGSASYYLDDLGQGSQSPSDFPR